MSLNPNQFGELEQLVNLLCDEAITVEQSARLQSIVQSDPLAMRYYIEFLDMHATYLWESQKDAFVNPNQTLGAGVNEGANNHGTRASALGSSQSVSTDPRLGGMITATDVGASTLLSDAAEPAFRNWLSHSNSSWFSLAIVMIMSIGGFAFLLMRDPRPSSDNNGIAKENVVKNMNQNNETVSAAKKGSLVARVSGVCDAVWQDGTAAPQNGELLPSGERLDLVGGFAEITFECGAVVMMNAPASLELKAVNGARINSGKISARVPGPSAKFWIQTPTNKILDLGTEFGIAIDSSGTSQIRVFDGVIEVGASDSITVAQDQKQSMLLRTGDVAVFGPNGEQLNKNSAKIESESSFVRTMPNNYESEYISKILAAKPAGYWSFNSVITTALIPDVSGKGRFGYMKGNSVVAQGGPILAIGQAMVFDGSTSSVTVPAAKSLSLDGDFSIEVLFRTPTGGPLVSKIAQDERWQEGSKLLYVRGGQVKFTPHISTKSDSLRARVYVNDDQWHHAVVTNKSRGRKDYDVTIIYVDGIERIRRDDWKFTREKSNEMPVVIGTACKKYPTNPEKNQGHLFPWENYFRGHLDEIAIYDRVVAAGEVKAHYHAYLDAGIARRRMSPEENASTHSITSMNSEQTDDSLVDENEEGVQ